MQEYTTHWLRKEAEIAKAAKQRVELYSAGSDIGETLKKMNKLCDFFKAVADHAESIINFDELLPEERTKILDKFTQAYRQANKID
jgi:predicted hydrocarbon binding protein